MDININGLYVFDCFCVSENTWKWGKKNNKKTYILPGPIWNPRLKVVCQHLLLQWGTQHISLAVLVSLPAGSSNRVGFWVFLE